MKAKVWIQLAVGLVIAFLVMYCSGLFAMTELADVVMVISDGFTVAAALYLGMGALIWISTTGFFDIFGFAFRRAAHAFIPNFFVENDGNYYEYKMKKSQKRKGFSQYSLLWIGLFFLIVSLVLTGIWYTLA